MKLLVCLSDDGRQRVHQNQARKIAGQVYIYIDIHMNDSGYFVNAKMKMTVITDHVIEQVTGARIIVFL